MPCESHVIQAESPCTGQSDVCRKECVCVCSQAHNAGYQDTQWDQKPAFITQLIEPNLKKQSICVGSIAEWEHGPFTNPYNSKRGPTCSLWHSYSYSQWWLVCRRCSVYSPMGMFAFRFPIELLCHKRLPVWIKIKKAMQNQKHKIFPINADVSFQGSKKDLKQALLYKLVPNCFLESTTLDAETMYRHRIRAVSNALPYRKQTFLVVASHAVSEVQGKLCRSFCCRDSRVWCGRRALMHQALPSPIF